jgi:hypothetical protein
MHDEVKRLNSVQSVLCSHVLSMKIKFKIHKTIILLIVLNGCETC